MIGKILATIAILAVGYFFVLPLMLAGPLGALIAVLGTWVILTFIIVILVIVALAKFISK